MNQDLYFIFFFFFNDTATTEIYTLSLHDALPISRRPSRPPSSPCGSTGRPATSRSEEHTSELQSQSNLVCRLLLEKKKQTARRGADSQRPRSSTTSRPASCLSAFRATPAAMPASRSTPGTAGSCFFF